MEQRAGHKKEYSILIAEDCPDTRMCIEEMLSIIDADVKTTLNGKECLDEAVNAWQNNEPYDLILLDIQMPIMDGNTATKSLRDKGYKLPIVTMSACSTDSFIEETKSAGCDAYVSKLGGMNQMLKEISKQLSKPKTPRKMELPTLAVVPQMIRNNPKQAHHALSQIEHIPARMQSLNSAIVTEDYDEIVQILMKLGAFSLLGYKQFAECILSMQDAASHADKAVLTRHFDKLKRHANSIIAGESELRKLASQTRDSSVIH